MTRTSILLGCLTALVLAIGATADQTIDLSSATIVARTGPISRSELSASGMLSEEISKRTGTQIPTASQWPSKGTVIALTSGSSDPGWGRTVPRRKGDNLPESKAEGFRLFVTEDSPGRPVIWVCGADGRGVLFGVGRLLREMEWGKGTATVPASLDIASSPAYAIRGHQLGYRDTANTYDAWDPAKYEQYIRDLVVFGANSIENIPLQDERPSPVMPISRAEMNVKMSEICDKYGLDYWVWVPADFDLNDQAKRAESLDRHEKLYKECPRMDDVFFPGGDPGDNDPKLVMPFLEDVAKRLVKYHPNAKIWLSLQGYTEKQCDYAYEYISQHMPTWFGGLVVGPSSPPIADSRKRLPAKYGLRHYPDITHCVRAQYPVQWWDPAFAMTLGREPVNPRPVYEAILHNFFAPYTNGFLSYSDGAHDDVNKTIWSAQSWDPNVPVRDVLVEYARYFFGPAVAQDAADGILGLERNWSGSLRDNGSVEGTLALWNGLDTRAPELRGNWRWQMCQLRATYDAYTRRRLLYESRLEDDANAILLNAVSIGPEKATTDATAVLEKAVTQPVSPDLRKRIDVLCEDLFKSIGFQTSVAKYHASGAERGAVLDFVDHPLNNRWWLEDEFSKVKSMPSTDAQVARLREIATWEQPGPGSFYDDIGNPAKSIHVVRGEGINTDPEMLHNPNPDHAWWDGGNSHARISWLSYMDWPLAVEYTGLDPAGDYLVRTTGQGQCLLSINGQRISPTLDGKKVGELKEFPVPAELVKGRALRLTFERPNEEGINWRQQSRLTEIWLIRRK